MREPPEELVKEWTESPVTQYVRFLIEEEVKTWDNKDLYYRADPQKTQEALLTMITEVNTFQRVQEALEGDFSLFDSEEE